MFPSVIKCVFLCTSFFNLRRLYYSTGNTFELNCFSSALKLLPNQYVYSSHLCDRWRPLKCICFRQADAFNYVSAPFQMNVCLQSPRQLSRLVSHLFSESSLQCLILCLIYNYTLSNMNPLTNHHFNCQTVGENKQTNKQNQKTLLQAPKHLGFPYRIPLMYKNKQTKKKKRIPSLSVQGMGLKWCVKHHFSVYKQKLQNCTQILPVQLLCLWIFLGL